MKRKRNVKTKGILFVKIPWENCLIPLILIMVLVRMDVNNLKMKTNHEFDLQIERMINNNEVLWKCKVCAKTAAKKKDIEKKY